MTQEKSSSIKYLVIFLIVLALFIIGSIGAKILFEITTSTFTQNSYSLLLVSKNDTKLIYVDKNDKKAVFLALGNLNKLIRGKNTISISFALGIPINGILLDENSPRNLSDFARSHNEMRLLFDSKHTTKNLNRLDLYKIVGAVRKSNEDNRIEKRLNILSPQGIAEVEEYFKDSSIINAPYTIQIDNGTTLNGLGNEFALILGKLGFNVISVRTSNEKGSSFVAHQGEMDSYIKTLIGLTGFDFREEKKSEAADVTIYLGDDLEAMLLE